MVTAHDDLATPPGARLLRDGRPRLHDHHAPAGVEVLGHYDLFYDMMVDCKESKKRYRYDQVRGRWVEKRRDNRLRRARTRREGVTKRLKRGL